MREASSTFGVDAQYKGMELRGKGSIREWDVDEKVVKDSKLLIEGDPHDSRVGTVSSVHENCATRRS